MERPPQPLSPEETRARIAEIDRTIIELTSTQHLSEVPAKNELGTSLEESGLEAEANFTDFSQEESRVQHLRHEKAALEAHLESLAKAA